MAPRRRYGRCTAACGRPCRIHPRQACQPSLYGRPVSKASISGCIALGADLGEAHYDYGVLLGLQEKWDRRGRIPQGARSIRRTCRRETTSQVLERATRMAESSNPAGRGEPTVQLARLQLGRMLLALDKMRKRSPGQAGCRSPGRQTARYALRCHECAGRTRIVGHQLCASRFSMGKASLPRSPGSAKLKWRQLPVPSA